MLNCKREVSISWLLIGLAFLVGCVADTYPLAKPTDWSRPEFWYQDSRLTDEKLVEGS